MQYTEHLGGSAAPGPGGGPLGRSLTDDVQALRAYYAQLEWRRRVHFWRFRILLVLLGGCLAGILGVLGVFFPLIVIGAVVAPAFIILTVKRIELGWMLLGVCSSPLIPPVLSARSLDVAPAELVLALLLVAVAARAIVHARSFVLPSFWVIWPQIGLIALAFMSEILIQVTWVSQVPKKLNSQPVVYSELLGLFMYTVPLLVVIATTACLTNRERWIPRFLNLVIVLAGILALIVCVEFKRIGGDIYSFRYSEPSIFYMHLGSVAQFIVIGTILAYARALYATRWRVRLAYGLLVVWYVVAIYVTLENARWLEIAVALAVMTLIYSRRFFLLCCALCLPLIPVAYEVVKKIEEVKGTRDANRFTIWSDIIRIWSKRPVLGVGPGNVWPFDQVFTQLPLGLRNLATTGLGVAHNGVLQQLVELGPLGVVLYYASATALAIAAVRLYRRARGEHARADRMFALMCIGLLSGALVADLVSGDMFRPPAQVGGFNDLPRVFTAWTLFGILIYKDQLWRLQRKLARVAALVRPVARQAQAGASASPVESPVEA